MTVSHFPGGGLVTEPAELELRFTDDADSYLRQGGVGGWDRVPVDRGKETVRFAGTPIHTATLAVLFDRWERVFTVTGAGEFSSTRSVEDLVGVLHLMALPPGGPRSGLEPRKVRVVGDRAGALASLTWVIQDVRYLDDDDVVWLPGHARARQGVEVELWEHSRPAVVLTPAQQAAPPAAAAAAAEQTHTVVAGDTLSAIAARLLGDGQRWTEIAELNGVRDPRALQVGAVLRIPPR